MFHKRIPEHTVRDSLLVIIVGITLIALVSIVVFYTLSSSVVSTQTTKFSIINTFYEASSAFGTVGLSMGITQNIGVAGLVLLILLMFIGQMGISVTLLS
jgi:Trk-type K+ transport system membrane component